MILILLFTYRSPILWILPIICAGRRLHHRRRRGLPAGQVRRPHGQRPEPVHPQHPGHRRRHRLRAAARRPLPRGAAPPRGPARGDGVRAAPRRTGDPRQRRHRRRRHAVPGLRRPQLHRRPRPGPRRRRRDHAPGDGHPAAGAARHLRPLDLLAEAAGVRLARADRHRPLGPGRRPDRVAPAPGLGRSPPLLLAVACLGLFKLDANGPVDRGLVHQEVRLDHGPEAARSSTASSTTPTPLQVVTNADRLAAIAGGPRRASTGSASRPEPREIEGGRTLLRGPDRGRLRDAGGVRHRRGRPRRRARRRRARTPSSAAARRSTSTPRRRRCATTR